MLQGGGWTWRGCLRAAGPVQYECAQGYCLKDDLTVMKLMMIRNVPLCDVIYVDNNVLFVFPSKLFIVITVVVDLMEINNESISDCNNDWKSRHIYNSL